MKNPITLAAVLAAFTLTTTTFAQSTLVVPVAPAATIANSNNAFPWNRRTAQIHFQQQYAASNFAGLTSPVIIQRLRFRAQDSIATTTSWTGGTYTGARISMSTAANVYTAMSATFAANHGPDLAQVFPLPGGTNLGSITVTPGTGTGGATPGAYYVDFALATPFLFDPTVGKGLVIDVQLDGTWVGGTAAQSTAYSGVAVSPQGTRVYNTTDWQGLTGTVGAEHSLGCEIVYIPASGLFASFSASPTSGTQNLSVQFKDTSFSSDPSGITSWTWDFGDGSPVSNAQNPLHIYTCGGFSPKLTVTDATHTPSSKTETNLISAGLVTADFTASGTFGTAPYSVTFTDTSTGGATAWEWDFGDSTPKSTLQNPTHIYTAGGKFTVTLKVTGACNNDSEIKTDLVEVCAAGGNSGSLSTIFTAGNGLTGNNVGNMFKVTVINPDGIKVTSLDVNSREPALGVIGIDVYITPTTYIGNNAKPEIWVKVATGSGPSAGSTGTTTPTNIDVNDFYLAPGEYGMYVNCLNGGVFYTTGTTAPSNLDYQNCDLKIETGYGMGLFSTGVNSPRVWGGTIRYAKNDIAANGKYGYGCPGSNTLIPDLSISAEPIVGGNGNLLVNDMLNAAAVPGFLFVGATKQLIDLAPLGMPTCFLHHDALATLPVVGINGTATLPFSIPNNAGLIGVQALLQAACTDSTVNSLGVTASNGLSLRLGN